MMNRAVHRGDEKEHQREAAMLSRKGLLIGAMGCAIGIMTDALPSQAADDARETAKESARSCITDKRAGIFDYGSKYTLEMDLENSCARKISCTVDVYVTSAKGPLNGHGVLVLKPRGQTTTLKTYTMKVKSNVGTAQAERHCKFVWVFLTSPRPLRGEVGVRMRSMRTSGEGPCTAVR